MKKFLTTLLFISAVLTATAQKQFEGTWTSKTSKFNTTILASKYAVIKVFNYSFEIDYFLEEKILSQNDNEFITKLYNPRNGYEVIIKYYFIKDELYCQYIGDYNGLVKLYKI